MFAGFFSSLPQPPCQGSEGPCIPQPPGGGGGGARSALKSGPLGRFQPVEKPLGGSGAAMQFAKVALRRPVGPSWRSLAHWASASLLPPLAALGFAPTEALIGFGDTR